ncbi:glycoside hydrolase family 127 protein [Echinicola marina]|nr:glycoside hydrolase family 127 protein [Echinicola marina]
MKVKKLLLFLLFIFFSLAIQAQNGDQMLDGIGETALVARYPLLEDLQDWSRNNLHGEFLAGEAVFEHDENFLRVLSFSKENMGYMRIPGETIEGLAALSISTWFNMQSTATGQVLFDFGASERNRLSVRTLIKDGQLHFQTIIVNEGALIGSSLTAVRDLYQWNHFVLILDPASNHLWIYLNGVIIEEISVEGLALEKALASFGPNNKCFIGRGIDQENSVLDAYMHDFRIYRIPLNEIQVKNIFHLSVDGEGTSQVNVQEKSSDDLPKFDAHYPQLYNPYLTDVADIEVKTSVGHLPVLPRYLKGVYQEGIDGPLVRVLWPAPKDNRAVLHEGEYTISGKIAGSSIVPKAVVKIVDAPVPSTGTSSLEAFELGQVRLDTDLQGRPSKFIENRDKFIFTLAKTNPDDFLYMFRNAFGQEQPEAAKPLGGWDSQETKLRGHATGHYLTAIAQAYSSSNYDTALQAIFKLKMDYMVQTLYRLSQLSGKPQKTTGDYEAEPTKIPIGPDKTAFNSDLSKEGIRTDYWNWGKGYISAYPPDQFIMLEQGANYGGQKNQIWAPYYTLHKILAGLMDIYEVSGNPKALEIAEGMGSWVHARLSQLPTETLIKMWNSYIAGEFGGMNEAMARLSRLTGQTVFLETAALFDNIKVFYGDQGQHHGLAKNVDTFRGLHANQHIPQIMGALEMYKETGLSQYFHIANNFWHMVTNDYMYSIGGVAGARNPANAECFINEPASLYENGFAAGGQNETCATYNMLKLSRQLFLLGKNPVFMDYYERGLYNHILASVAENSPANTYHVPLRPGSLKHFGNPDMKGFTCCNGTALESSTKLQNSIYFKDRDNQSLFVNLFVPSTLNWTERQISIVQSTSFPREDQTRLSINGNGKFTLYLRVPQWASEGFSIMINGKELDIDGAPGTYVKIARQWNDGDTVEYRIPFQFHLEPVMDQQNIASLFYGPVLLAAQENAPRKAWRKVRLNAKDIGKSIEADPEQLEFIIDGISYKPFYDTYGRYSVYLDVLLE